MIKKFREIVLKDCRVELSKIAETVGISDEQVFNI